MGSILDNMTLVGVGQWGRGGTLMLDLHTGEYDVKHGDLGRICSMFMPSHVTHRKVHGLYGGINCGGDCVIEEGYTHAPLNHTSITDTAYSVAHGTKTWCALVTSYDPERRARVTAIWLPKPHETVGEVPKQIPTLEERVADLEQSLRSHTVALSNLTAKSVMKSETTPETVPVRYIHIKEADYTGGGTFRIKGWNEKVLWRETVIAIGGNWSAEHLIDRYVVQINNEDVILRREPKQIEVTSYED